MKNTVINTTSIKKLIPYSYGAVVHFCRTSARLYGKLALREQLDYETETGDFSSFAMVDQDREGLKREIISLASACVASIHRLNGIAKTHGIIAPMSAVGSMSLTETIAAITDYVEALVAESDYCSWVKGLEEENKKPQ